MTDKTKDTPFDLGKALAPLRVATPDLGTLVLDIRTTSFLSWLDRGAKAGTWASGSDFMRDLLKERASRHEGEDGVGEPWALAPEHVDGMDEVALERTATAILDVARPHLNIFDPQASEDPPGRNRSDDAPQDGAQAPGSPVALRDLALGYLAADRERSRELGALLAGERNRIGRAFGFAVDAQKLLGHSRAFSSLLRGTELRSLQALAQSPVADMAKQLAASGVFAQAAAASKLTHGLNRQMAGIAQGAALNPWLERNSVLALAQVARLSWVKDVSRTLDLGIRSGVAEAIGRMTADTRLATGAAFAAAAMLRPGFQTVGTLALAGSVARGLAADVLGSYDLTGADAGELFASAVSCVALLDDDEATSIDRADALHRFMDLLGGFTAYLGDQVQHAGLVAILGLLISIAAIYPDYRALLDPSDPKPAPEMVETNARLTALAARIESDGERATSERTRIRYVHAPSPLRVGADRSAMRMRTVFPDQIAEVLDEEGSWAKVAVFDYRSNQRTVGWMHRRNLHVRPN